MVLHFSFKDNPAQSNNDCHYLTDLQFITRFSIYRCFPLKWGQYLLLTQGGVVSNRRRPWPCFPNLALARPAIFLAFARLSASSPAQWGQLPRNTRGCLRSAFGQSETPTSRQACTGRPAVIWGPPPNFRELRKKRPGRNYTSAVFAYYWRLETRLGNREMLNKENSWRHKLEYTRHDKANKPNYQKFVSFGMSLWVVFIQF